MQTEKERILGRASELGLVVDRLKALLDRSEKEIEDGLLPAAQIAMARNGELLFEYAVGKANQDSLICIFSATKAITSAAAWLLIQDGTLRETEKVSEIIPEFATNGKEAITVDQLFTHTAGFPSAPFAPLEWDDPIKRFGRFSKWRLNWQPGTQFEYHPSSSMWVIAEIIERKAKIDFRTFVRERVLAKLGLKNIFVGLPDEETKRALDCSHVGDALTEDEYRNLGMPIPPQTEVTEEAILAFNRSEVRKVGVPGGGGFASAGDMALFYQSLMFGGSKGGERLWSETTLRDVKKIRTGGLTDRMFKKPANRALGLIISGDNSRTFRGFGKTNSPLAFGHNGAGGQVAWADPSTGISFTYLTPAHDRNSIRQGSRGVALSSLAASCVD